MNFALLFSVGIVLILCCYYGGIWLMYKRPTLDSPHVRTDIPHQFSPVLLHLFWTGKLEWSALMLIGLHAVQEKIYVFQKNRNHKSVRFRLVAPERFGKLAHEERAAFSMGRGVPLPDIIFAKKRRPIHAEMMNRLEAYIRKTYKAYLLPCERLVYLGFFLQWLLFLTIFQIAPEGFWEGMEVHWNFHALVMGIITIMGGRLIINRLRWENRALSWTSGVMLAIALFVTYFMFIGNHQGIYSIYVFIFVIHGAAYHYLPRLTKKAWPYAGEISAFRNHLIQLQSNDKLPDELAPYAYALDLDVSMSQLNKQVLAEENVTEGEWLQFATEGIWRAFVEEVSWSWY